MKDINKTSPLDILCIVDDQKKILDELNESKTYLKKTECVAKMGFTILNLKTNNIFIYDSLYSLCGLDKTSAFSQKDFINKTVHPDYINYVQKNIDLAIKGIQEYNINHRIVRPGGKEIYVHSIAELVLDADGNPEALLGTSIDITERKEAEKDLIKSKEKAEQLEKLKTEFLTQMSHEIRTPLNNIINNPSLVKAVISRAAGPEAHSYFNNIEIYSKCIIRTVDLILNMSQIQTGSIQLLGKEVDLVSQISKPLIYDYNVLAASKSTSLSFDSFDENRTHFCDEYFITQIISNLIDNAIKYTSNGKVEVSLFKDKKNELILEIADTRLGMSEKFKESFFNHLCTKNKVTQENLMVMN